ncbi:PdaC/SigV domain-containing protein [Paenibacillus hodogayensis]|uniref:PdaC/SigV domain-containing protein n=1 Tax=Paenibacillus hodogayensis TaxID=279208 RepID=A0ABV5VSH7_9BACL
MNREQTNTTQPKQTARHVRSWLLALFAGALIAVGPAVAGFSSAPAYAETASPLVVVSQPFVIDGTPKALPAANVNGNTYIGLRELNEQLGLKTEWNPDTRIGTASGRGRTMTLGADFGTYTLNGQDIYGLPAILQDGTVYMPLRFLLEQMGYGISYDPVTRVIGIETIEENALTIQTSTIADSQDKQTLLVQYPQLAGFANAEVQQSINAYLKEEAETYADWGREELAKAAAANVELEASDESIKLPPVNYEAYYRITYNEKNRLSLYVDYYLYTGGAHGSTQRHPYTFDLATGKQLSLKEVAENNPDYVSIVNETIRTHIEETDLPMLATFETIEPERPFFLKNDSVVVYFEQYEYTPYASGMPEFETPFEAFRQS